MTGLGENGEELRASQIKQREEIQTQMKEYLNPHDRFANRMRASLSKSKGDDAKR